MKNQPTFLSKLLPLLMLFLFVNCEKEEITETPLQTTDHGHTNFQFSEKPLEDFIAEDKKFVTAYKQVTSKEKEMAAKGESHDFTINPDKVVKIENEGRVTYTMSIEKQDKAIGTFSNLVIEVADENSEHKVYIVEYSPGNDEMSYVAEHNSFSFNGSVTITRIDFDAKDLIAHREETCLTLSMTFCNWGGLEHIAGTNCTLSHMYSRPYQYCYDTSDPIFGGGGGGGGGGVPTVPILDDGENPFIKLNAVITALEPTQGQKVWLKNNIIPTVQIFEFLDENHYSDESIAFAKEAVEIMRLNPDISSIEEVTDYLIENEEIYYVEIKGPKIDPKEETKCFDLAKPAKVTLYVEQPIPNSREITASIGHTFIGIEQDGVSRHLGFYPDSDAASLLSPQDAQMHENSGDIYDVSITMDVSPGQLTNVINFINEYPEVYDLNNYNCSDFGIDIVEKCGVNLPRTIGVYDKYIFKFEGRNPADLGQDIRSMSLPTGVTRNNTGGNAPTKKGGC